MKHLKYFENKDNNKLSVGDYVVIQPGEDFFTDSYNEFLSTHIGVVREVSGDIFYVDFIFNENDSFSVKVEYCHNQGFRMEHLKYHSKSLEDLKIKINADKYNL